MVGGERHQLPRAQRHGAPVPGRAGHVGVRGAPIFSIAGRSFDDLRQRMKEEMLEMLMWARINREKRWTGRA